MLKITILVRNWIGMLYSFLFVRGTARASKRPSIPENILAGRGDADNSVTVSWSPATNAKGYLVFRSKDYNGPFFPIGKTATETRYVDREVSAGIYYWYRVASTEGFRVSEPGPRIQGWVNPFMPGGSETPRDLIKRLLLSLPHFFSVRREAINRQLGLYRRPISNRFPTTKRVESTKMLLNMFKGAWCWEA